MSTRLKPRLPPSLLFALIVGSMITGFSYTSPTRMVQFAGCSGWLFYFPSLITGLLTLYAMKQLYRGNEDATLPDVYRLAFGKPFGTFMVWFYILYLLYIASLILRVVAEITKTYYLPNTPVAALCLAASLMLIYGMYKGANAVFRINLLLIVFPCILVLLMLHPWEQMDFGHLLPIGDFGQLQWQFILPTIAFLAKGLDVLLVFYRFIEKKEKFVRHAMGGVLFLVLFCVVLFLTCLAVFGTELLAKLTFPTVSITEALSPGASGRLELAVVLVFLFITLLPPVNYCMAAYVGLQDMIANTTARKIMPWGIAAIVFALSLIPKNIDSLIHSLLYNYILFSTGCLCRLRQPFLYALSKKGG